MTAPTEMKALTVQQPWAWAIIHGGKTIENRTTLWKYRGPLAIHAGKRFSNRGAKRVLELTGNCPLLYAIGAVIGVVDLVDAHYGHPHCCDGHPASTPKHAEYVSTCIGNRDPDGCLCECHDEEAK